MNCLTPIRFTGAILFTAIMGVVFGAVFAARASAQDVPDLGPKPHLVIKPMESHIGNVTGHAAAAKSDYRRYCAGCHGDFGDSNGENAGADPPHRTIWSHVVSPLVLN